MLILFPNNLTDQQDAENVSDSDNISSCSSDSEESEEAKDDDGEDVTVVQLSWKPSGGPVSLGEWEQHTKVSCLEVKFLKKRRKEKEKHVINFCFVNVVIK